MQKYKWIHFHVSIKFSVFAYHNLKQNNLSLLRISSIIKTVSFNHEIIKFPLTGSKPRRYHGCTVYSWYADGHKRN